LKVVFLYGIHDCPKLAVLRSPGSVYERRLWRKRSLKLDEPAARDNPKPTLIKWKIDMNQYDFQTLMV